MIQKIEHNYSCVVRDSDKTGSDSVVRLPSEADIGYLVNITVGHTSTPIDSEIAMWTLHLKEAGFLSKVKSASPEKKNSMKQSTSFKQKSLSKTMSADSSLQTTNEKIKQRNIDEEQPIPVSTVELLHAPQAVPTAIIPSQKQQDNSDSALCSA
jgi:hypothetical protein